MIQPNQPVKNAWHFVVSSPRSGSTWLARALNHHPEIIATENRLFGYFCEIWKNPNGKSAPRITADQFLRGFSRHSFFEDLGYESANEMEADLTFRFVEFLGSYLRERSGKPVIVDKVTPYRNTATRVLFAAQQHLNSKFVHLIRDGRDVAVSGVFDWIARANETSDRYRFFVKQDSSIRLQRLFDDEILAHWASYWMDPLLTFRAWRNLTHEIRYESMLDNQAEVLASVFEYLGVSSDQAIAKRCAEAVTFEKTTGRESGAADQLAKARKGIAGDWKNYFTRADALRFQELTGDMLQGLGYESDTSWIDRCPEQLDLKIEDHE